MSAENIQVVAIDAGTAVYEDLNNPGERWNADEHFLTVEAL